MPALYGNIREEYKRNATFRISVFLQASFPVSGGLLPVFFLARWPGTDPAIQYRCTMIVSGIVKTIRNWRSG